MAQCSAAAKPYAPAYASCAAACCAASVASFAPGSRLLGVSVILGALSRPARPFGHPHYYGARAPYARFLNRFARGNHIGAVQSGADVFV